MGTALGYTIKELRREKGISQRELAAAMGLGTTAINNYENGYRTPDADVVIRLSKYFDVSTDYLLGMSHFRDASTWSNTEAQAINIANLLEDLRPDVRDKFLPTLEDFILDGADTESCAIILNRLSNILRLLKAVKSSYGDAVISYVTSSDLEQDSLYHAEKLRADLADRCFEIVHEVEGLRKELSKLFIRDMKTVQTQARLMACGDTVPRRAEPEAQPTSAGQPEQSEDE